MMRCNNKMVFTFFRVKQEHGQQMREIRKTGGVVPPPALPEKSEVLSMIGSEVNDLGSEFDSDASPRKSHNKL